MGGVANWAEEDLRYYACVGHEKGVRELLSLKVDVNSRNAMNGWTALHWAANRNHSKIVEMLLQHGANPWIQNNKGETAAHLTKNTSVHKMLGESPKIETWVPHLPITPSYLKYPALPVSVPWATNVELKRVKQANIVDFSKSNQAISKNDSKNELLLKVRVAEADDPDFIEIEIDKEGLTFEKLMEVCCEEFKLERKKIMKLRKMPNTIIRKDKDVNRLVNYQEIEIVLYHEDLKDLC